jgi:hypothetical protein
LENHLHELLRRACTGGGIYPWVHSGLCVYFVWGWLSWSPEQPQPADLRLLLWTFNPFCTQSPASFIELIRLKLSELWGIVEGFLKVGSKVFESIKDYDSFFSFSFLLFFFGGARDWTQGLTHGEHVF